MAAPEPGATSQTTGSDATAAGPAPSRLGRWVVHPFLLAAYPVLFLFAENAADQLSFDPVWLPLAASVAGAVVLFAIAWALFRDPHPAGIATTLLVAAFFSYGHVWNLVEGTLPTQLLLLSAYALLVGIGLGLVIGFRDSARGLTAGLNVLAVVPLLFTLISLGDFAISRGAVSAVTQPVSGLLAGSESGERPDIYWLVFDRYAGPPSLQKHFGFDDEPFLRELEERGFYVMRNSVANYPKTSLSLTSTLEMEYLDGDELNAEASDPSDQGPINRRFQGRLTVPSELKELGYRFVLVPSWWPPTASNVDADLTFRYEGASEFTLALLDTTMITAFTGPQEEIDPFAMSELRNATLYQIDQMIDVPNLPGPKFVMAHFLIPHPPSLFDRDGSGFEGDESTLSASEKYVRQTEFTNSQILRMVDAIRSQADGEEPIIIVQADEGPFPERYAANGDTFQWADATPEEYEIKYRILNAVYLGGRDAEAAGMHESFTPINEFRVVFNAVFDAGLPLLGEHIYAHTDYRHFYDFFEISDRIPGWPD